MQTKTRRSNFSLTLTTEGGIVSGVCSGSSGKGSFYFKAQAKTFDELMSKFEGLVPWSEDPSEFYDAGSGTDGNVSEPSNSSAAGKPTNCS